MSVSDYDRNSENENYDSFLSGNKLLIPSYGEDVLKDFKDEDGGYDELAFYQRF